MDIAYNKTDGVVLPITNTRISASEYNQIAASLMQIITSAGLTPDAANNVQLLNALKAMGSGWPMPSDTYINLTLGASGTSYTAPANGYVYIGRQSSAAGQYVEINAGYSAKTRIWSSAGSQSLQQTLPVRKGKSFVIGYTAGGAQEFFRFVYAEGAKEEAN